jgi:hypothetical protein
MKADFEQLAETIVAFGTLESNRRRGAARLLAAVLVAFAALHGYWATGGTWGLETAIGPGAARPSSGAIWGMTIVLLLFALTAFVVSRVPTGDAPVAAHLALGLLSFVAAAVGLLNIVMGTRPAERLGIGPFAMAVALLAGHAASGRRRAARARAGVG